MAAVDTSSRDEIVGHCTLCVLALLGMALYSITYSLIYMGGDSTPVTAVLEMWMTTTHLCSAAACCIIQTLLLSVLDLFDKPIHHIAEAQTTLFLGIALAVTILGNSCIQSTTGAECGIYFGAAAIPRISAAGTAAWSWVMYISSLGCQQWSSASSLVDSGGDNNNNNNNNGKLLSLGLSGMSPLTATAIMLLLPLHITSKLSSTCDSLGWAAKVCSSASTFTVYEGNTKNNNNNNSSSSTTTTTTTAAIDCSNLSTGEALAVSTLVIGLLLAWGGKVLTSFSPNWSRIPRILGAMFMTLGPLCVWAAQGNAPIVPPVSYHITAACLSAITLVSELWHLIIIPSSNAANCYYHCHQYRCCGTDAGDEEETTSKIRTAEGGTTAKTTNLFNNYKQKIQLKLPSSSSSSYAPPKKTYSKQEDDYNKGRQATATTATATLSTQARLRPRAMVMPHHAP